MSFQVDCRQERNNNAPLIKCLPSHSKYRQEQQRITETEITWRDVSSTSEVNIAWFSLSLVFDQLDVVSYEEVVRLPAFKRKTLVLIGISS